MQDFQRALHILVVDDDRSLRFMMQTLLEDRGYQVSVAVNGRNALDLLEISTDIDLILLDREMPEMNGMQTVHILKQHPRLKRIPIIMVTGSDRPEQVREGIDAGVFYYLSKPINQEILMSVLQAAVREAQQRRHITDELRKHQQSFNSITHMTCVIKTLDDAENIAAFIANCFPDPERVMPGVIELVINAVEHGNAGISYDEKTRLVADGKWRDEIERRLKLSENADKCVTIAFKRTDEGYTLTIMDEGTGFNWENYLDVDPARATHNHGRGIAQARTTSFDVLRYNTLGNAVTAIVKQAAVADANEAKAF